MKKLFLSLAIGLLAVIAIPVPQIQGATFQSGDSLLLTTRLADDLYATARTLGIKGKISGDVVAAAVSFETADSITGDLIVAANNISITGTVGDDVRAAGSNIDIVGDIGDDLIVMGGRVVIGENSYIGGDIHATVGELIVKGFVKGNIRGRVGTLTIEGKVEKNVEVMVDTSLDIIGQGFVKGDVNYSSWKPLGIAKERIGGELIFSKGLNEKTVKEMVKEKAQSSVFIILALFVLGFFITKFAPKLNARTLTACRANFWKNLVIGIFWTVLIPALSVLLMITIIGIPLALLLLALYAMIMLFALPTSALLIGSTMFRPFEAKPWERLAQLLIGLVVLCLLWNIPVIGWITVTLLILSSSGAVLLSLRNSESIRKENKKPASDAEKRKQQK